MNSAAIISLWLNTGDSTRDTMVLFKVLTRLKPLKSMVKLKLKSGEDPTLPLLQLLNSQTRDVNREKYLFWIYIVTTLLNLAVHDD